MCVWLCVCDHMSAGGGLSKESGKTNKTWIKGFVNIRDTRARSCRPAPSRHAYFCHQDRTTVLDWHRYAFCCTSPPTGVHQDTKPGQTFGAVRRHQNRAFSLVKAYCSRIRSLRCQFLVVIVFNSLSILREHKIVLLLPSFKKVRPSGFAPAPKSLKVCRYFTADLYTIPSQTLHEGGFI